MKKARYNYSTITTTTVATRTLENTHSHGAEKLTKELALPNPPSEETVARLNAIAREYPFCAYFKHSNLSLL